MQQETKNKIRPNNMDNYICTCIKNKRQKGGQNVGEK